MFGWVGRRSRIEREAKVLAELTFGMVGAARRNSFDECVNIMRRSQFHETYCDVDERRFGFCIVPPPKTIFAFELSYTNDGPSLTGEGYQQYFGLYISAKHDEAIYADLSEFRPRHELGVDAEALQKALLKFPYFTSMGQLYERFRREG